MATLRESLEALGPLDAAEYEHLSLLVSDWQIIADLSFADLVLWRRSGEGFVAIAQCRPSTGSTVHLEDVVGRTADAARVEHLHNAVEQGTLVTARVPRWDEPGAVREEAGPVVRQRRSNPRVREAAWMG